MNIENCSGNICFRWVWKRLSSLLPCVVAFTIIVTIVSYINVQLCDPFHGCHTTNQMSLASEYHFRQEQLRKSCKKPQNVTMDKIFYSKNHNLCYCGVAKGGCTFWKQVIRFLNNDTGSHRYKHPLDIPRAYVHFNMMNTTQTEFQGKEEFFSNFDRFMFVRDPYTRFWSAYIDKIFLPDLWNQLHSLFSPEHGYCLNAVTFEESLRIATETPMDSMNSHWVAMAYACDPCRFRPKFIGKQESFYPDARSILARHSLSWILNARHRSFSEEEMEMLITYNFKLLSKPKLRSCIDKVELAKRLWKAFQMNGHLSSEVQLNLPKDGELSASKFASIVFDEYSKQAKTAEELKLQKYHYLKEAYKGVSTKAISQIREKYALDFEMFGYDPFRPDIFGE